MMTPIRSVESVVIVRGHSFHAQQGKSACCGGATYFEHRQSPETGTELHTLQMSICSEPDCVMTRLLLMLPSAGPPGDSGPGAPKTLDQSPPHSISIAPALWILLSTAADYRIREQTQHLTA